MEDSKNAPPQSKGSASPADRIIELTPELEVISASRSKIIDLTQVLFSPGATQPSKPVPTATATPKPIVARTASPFSAKISRSKGIGIESDVDAAFDYIQSKAEELRGPRVEPAPSVEDLRVSVPAPIGDWDDTIAAEPLMPEEAPAPPPSQDPEEEPAEPAASPMTFAISEAFSVITAEASPEASSMVPPTADDALEFKDVTHPADLSPPDEVPAAHIAADDTTPAPAAPETMKILDEEPTSLLEAAIEIDETEKIIELTEIVSAEDLAAAQAAQVEEIIELTEIVSAEDLAAAGYMPPGAVSAQVEADQAEIIELTDIASAEDLAAAGNTTTDMPAPQARQAQEEEEIIELVDRVELPLPEETAAMASELVQNPPVSLPEFEPEVPAPPDLEAEDSDTEKMTLEVFTETQAPPEPTPSAIQPETDQVIRLDSVLGHVRKNQERVSEEITLGIEEVLAGEPLSSGDRFPIGIAMEEVQQALGPKTAPTEEDIEAVIERVILTKYGQTIEQMIATVVEKVVTREMNNIKRDLMEDQGESDEL